MSPARSTPAGAVQSTNRRSRRAGFTLIELLAVIAVGGALLGMATATLYLMLRNERAGRRDFLLSATLGRLDGQFRRDAHGADAVEPLLAKVNGAARAWEFRCPAGETIEYRCGEDKLVRLQRVDGQPVRREEYALPTGAEVAIEADPAALAVLCITAPVDQSAPGVRRGVRIEAALGFARRHATDKERSADAPEAK